MSKATQPKRGTVSFIAAIKPPIRINGTAGGRLILEVADDSLDAFDPVVSLRTKHLAITLQCEDVVVLFGGGISCKERGIDYPEGGGGLVVIEVPEEYLADFQPARRLRGKVITVTMTDASKKGD